MTLGVIRWHRFHGHLAADDGFSGVQKFHRHSLARIGGVGVALGLTAAAVVLWLDGRGIAREFALLLVAGIPAFAGGGCAGVLVSGGGAHAGGRAVRR